MRKTTRRRRNKNDSKQLVLSMVAVVAFLSIWQTFFPPPVPVQPAESVQETTSQEGALLSELSVSRIAEATRSATTMSSGEATGSSVTSLAPATPRHTLLDQDRFEVILNSHGQIDRWAILETQYRHRISETETEPYLLTSNQPQLTPEGHLTAPFLSPQFEVWVEYERAQGEYAVSTGSTPTEATFTLTTPLVEIKRVFTLQKGQYRLKSTITVRNLTTRKVHIELRGVTRALQNANESEGGMFSPPLNLLESVCAHGDEVERDSLSSLRSKIEDQDPTEFSSARWMGVDSRYFMSAFNSSKPISCAQSDQLASLNLKSVPSGFSPLSTTGKIAQIVLEANASVSEEITVYGGPKKLELLDAAEPKLGNAIDFGIFSPICLPMLWAMGLFFGFISNWGIAIILLTILVKLLTLPLTIKQYRSMAAMKKLQPLLAGIKEKYGDDQMRVQQETMALYKREGVNPLAGCLPMLVMMPIYFALYRTIYSAVELYQARFFGWLTDLSMPDPYFITPVILAGLMFLQSQLQPTNSSMDAAQRRLLTVFMPLMFGAMMLFLPSGLVLYILVNTVLGLIQQLWTNRQAENT